MPLASPASRHAPRPKYRTLDGKIVPSVTTVINVISKPWLIPWANRLGLQGINSTEYVGEAAGAGTLTHAAIEATFRGIPLDAALIVEFSDEERAAGRVAWANFKRWRVEHEVEPLLIEQQMVSERLRVGGTLDFFAVVDGRRSIVDFKTSNSVYDTHVVQLSAYRSLLEETGVEVDEVRVVTLPRDPAVERGETVVVDTTPYLEVFERALGLYHAQRTMGQFERTRKDRERIERDRQRIEADLARMVQMSEPELAALVGRGED